MTCHRSAQRRRQPAELDQDQLIGTKCNRTAIGARVRVVTGNMPRWMKSSSSSVMSQCDLRLHFGLGKADRGCHRSQVADHAED
jgi:hypothetical protein